MSLMWLDIFAECLWAWLLFGLWCERRQSGWVKRLMAWGRKSKVNGRHNVPVASLPTPTPHSHLLLTVSLSALRQVRSSGFLAQSWDTPIDPHYCRFIKTFPHWATVCVCGVVVLCCIHAFATGFSCYSTTQSTSWKQENISAAPHFFYSSSFGPSRPFLNKTLAWYLIQARFNSLSYFLSKKYLSSCYRHYF